MGSTSVLIEELKNAADPSEVRTLIQKMTQNPEILRPLSRYFEKVPIPSALKKAIIQLEPSYFQDVLFVSVANGLQLLELKVNEVVQIN